MNYTSFCNTLLSELTARSDGMYSVSREVFRKNNGVMLEAVCVHPADHCCSAIVHLPKLYQMHLAGTSMESICGSVFSCLDDMQKLPPDVFPDLWDSEQTGSLVAYRLVSRKNNEALLRDIPWIPFLDLAVVFYLALKHDGPQQLTALLNHHHAECLGLSAEKLMELARRNTPLLYPASLCSLESMLMYFKTGCMEPELRPQVPIFILTNHSGYHGAACLLYDNILKDFADREGSDIMILPSSVHEVLLIPDSHTRDYEEFRRMVCEINRTEVSVEDRLSDEIYLYSRKEQRLTLWTPPASHDTQGTDGTESP